MTGVDKTVSALACAIMLCVGTSAWAQESSPVHCWRPGGCDGPNVTGFGTGTNATAPEPPLNYIAPSISNPPNVTASCPDGYEMVWRFNMRLACAKEVIDAR